MEAPWSSGWHVRLWTDRSVLRICLMPEYFDLVYWYLGISRRVCATGHMNDPLPLVEKSRVTCPSGRFPPSFNHHPWAE